MILQARIEQEKRKRQRTKRLAEWKLNPLQFAVDAGMPNLDPWQRQVLLDTNLLILLACARQVGKSTICALLVVRQLLCFPDSTIVVIAPTQRQSQELYRVCLRIYKRLGRPVRYTSVQRTYLELENNSRILVLPGGNPDSIRGVPAVSLICCDESARCSDDLYSGFAPMLSVSQGRLICASSPAGKRGFFWNLWSEDADASRYTIKASECPRISKTFLMKEKYRLGWQMYAQEFESEFLEGITSAFRASDIKGLLSDELEYDHDLMAG